MEQIQNIILNTISIVKAYSHKIYKQNHTRFKWELFKCLFSNKIAMQLEKKYLFYDLEKLNSIDLLSDIINKKNDLQDVYDLFNDQQSKDIFKWLIQFRIAYLLVGSYAFDIFPPKKYNNMIHCVKKGLLYYKVKNYKINCGNEIYEIWEHEQYNIEGICGPENGDTVISAGALNGETSIWLADNVGENGMVFAFEPFSTSLKKLKSNIKRNNLNKNINPIGFGIWKDNQKLYLHEQIRPGENWCSDNKSKHEIEVVKIDSFVEQNRIKVDMIKMDIEGSEYNALIGAKQTLQKYNPKLAISIYHLHDDLIHIPKLIKEINPNYKLYLSHKSYTGSEIILFAKT